MLENETTIGVEALVAEAERLRQQGARLVTATGLDEGDHFDVIYHFALETKLHHLRLSVAKADTVPSISGVFPGAFLIENEMKELLGVQITGISVDYGGRLFLVEGGPERPLAKTEVSGVGGQKPGAGEPGKSNGPATMPTMTFGRRSPTPDPRREVGQ